MINPHAIPVRIKLLRPGVQPPVYSTAGSAGCDVVSMVGASFDSCDWDWQRPKDAELIDGLYWRCMHDGIPYRLSIECTRLMIPLGIAIDTPPGYEAQIRPRSGNSSRGLSVELGTVDWDYRGELCVTLWSSEDCIIRPGDRIGQLVFAPVVQAEFEVVDSLTDTERGAGGHGSTGR